MKIQGNININDLLRLFNRGIRSVSGFHKPLATLLGITAFVFALSEGKWEKLSSFHWLPKTRNPDENLVLVPGLQNLGNNCFLNVILQAIEECERSLDDENLLDSLPLAVALDTLLEELCVVGEGRVVLSPQRVMLMMAHYIPSFNLTAQQDAAEALLHLLSSLREEFAGCYGQRPRSLLEFCSSNCRIINPKREDGPSEQERWKKSFIGPFDGILGSVLTCQSCSSQISLNLEAFSSLPLSPVPDNGSTIMVGCSLEDCLKQFSVAEQLENYHCTTCWHIAGIKYLSLMEANESEIEKLRTCTKQDYCDCRITYGPDKFPWSNKFSRTLKQMSIALSPKILCIQLKRVSMNMLGDLVKLQGHISFPLVLDLFSFMTIGVAVKAREESLQRVGQRRYQNPSFYTENFGTQMQRETRNSDNLYDSIREGFFSEDARDSSVISDSIEHIEYSKAPHMAMEMQSAEQIATSSQSVSLNSCLYRLVSVVEHFGRPGSGHYTVYRSSRSDSLENELTKQSEPGSCCWFCISDSEVHWVSEKDVLSTEASLLFYEKISQG